MFGPAGPVTHRLRAAGSVAVSPALNEYVAQVNAIAHVPDDDSKTLSEEVDRVLPQMKTDVSEMETAQTRLTGRAAEVAGTTTALAQHGVVALEHLQNELFSNDLDAARTTMSEFLDVERQIQEQIKVWNAEIATGATHR